MNKAIWILLLLWPWIPVFAQAPDLTLSIEKQPPGLSPPGTSGIIEFTISNIGPGSARASTGVTRLTPSDPTGSGVQPIVYRFLDGPCTLFAFEPPLDTFTPRATPVLDPGESVICRWSWEILEKIDVNELRVRWSLIAFDSAQDEVNTANNTDSVLFVLRDVRKIPTLTVLGLIVLILAMIVATPTIAGRR